MASYRTKVYRKQGGEEQVIASGGTLTVESGGTVANSGTFSNATGAKLINSNVITATANQTLAAGDSGITVLLGVSDLRVNLPAATTAGKGWEATVILASGGLSTGTGFKVKPQSSDKIMGAGLTPADGKSVSVVGATDDLGDFVRVKSDASQGYYIVGHEGTLVNTTAT